MSMKLCDDFLRPVAADADDDEALYGEESPSEEELIEEGKEGLQ